MDKCPTCNRKFRSIEDFERIYVHSVNFKGLPSQILTDEAKYVKLTPEEESKLCYDKSGSFQIDDDGSIYVKSFSNYYKRRDDLASFIKQEFDKHENLKDYIDFLTQSKDKIINPMDHLISWKRIKPEKERWDPSGPKADEQEKARYLSKSENSKYFFELEFEELDKKENNRICVVNLYGCTNTYSKNRPIWWDYVNVYEINKLATILEIEYSGILNQCEVK